MPGEKIQVQGPAGVREFDAPATVSFGRESDNDIVCDSGAVSRHHATLSHDGQGWVLRDSGSANGTFVGGVRVGEQRIAGPVSVRFGPADGGVTVALTPLDLPAAPPPPGPPPGAPPGPPPGAPGAAPPPLAGVNPGSTIDIRSLGVGSGAPPLAVVANGKRREFSAGQAVTIGRDATNVVVIDDDLVSGLHAQVAYQPGAGWTVTDSSRNGTYVDGKRMQAPYRVQRRAVLSLGAATGAEVELAPILSDAEAAKLDRKEGRKRRSRVLAFGAVGVIIIAAVVVGLYFGLKGSGNKEAAHGLSAAALDNAKLATVQIIASSGGKSESDWLSSGSGSILTPDGIILTNAHVAAPGSPGLAVTYGPSPGGEGEDNAKTLLVAVTPKPDAPPVIKYRAKVVAADGYLDFAVIKIYEDADGNKIDTSKLNLPTLKVGSVKHLDIGAHVTTIGFPEQSQNFSKLTPAAVADGKINTFVPDVYGRVKDSRYQIVTDADIKHGNSGGAAIDDEGELIAVPSAGLPGQGNDISNRLRSVDLAEPLIKDAKDGDKYTSPYSSPGTGKEEFVGYDVATSKPSSCKRDTATTDIDGPAKKFYIQLALTGMRKGEDIVVVLGPPGELGQDPDLLKLSPVARWESDSSSGCQTLEVDAALPDHGKLAFQVFAGTQLKAVSNEVDLEW